MSKTHIIIHYSASSKNKTTTKDINNWHRKRNWGTIFKPVYAQKSSLGFYCQYHEVIEVKGLNIQCRKETENAWHSGDYKMNRDGYAICIINDGKEKLDDEQVYKLRDRLRDLRAKFNIPVENILGHNEVNPTICPGAQIKMDFIRDLAKETQEDSQAKIKNELILSLDALLNATKTVLSKAKQL